MSLCKHHDVRTTLTLDDDVAALLKKEVRKSGMSFKGAVNHFLRRGMAHSAQQPARQRFVVHSRPLGLPAGMSYDDVGQLLEDLEGPLHR